jgi:hypothetical protein
MFFQTNHAIVKINKKTKQLMCVNNNKILQNKILFLATGNRQRKQYLEYSSSAEPTVAQLVKKFQSFIKCKH